MRYIDLDITPTAVVAPVRHGHWIKKSIYDSVCSVCGTDETEYIYGTEMWYGNGKSKYCPNCGARMDGEYKNCGTCKHHDKWWDEIICDGCTKAHSNWERRDDD